MTTQTIITRRQKLNIFNIIPNSDPEPKNRRTSGRVNYNGIKKGRLYPVFRPVMVPESQPRDKLAEANH